jgi:hypothetical protein
MEHYKVDEVNNRIELLDNRFYEFEGQFYPSVTTILEAYPKGPAFYDWLKKVGENADDIRDEFGKRGSVVHNLTEQYDKELPVTLMSDGRPQYSSMEWAMFERYVEFQQRFKPRIIEIEGNYTSHELGFGGTLDRIIKLNGKIILLDIKTSNYLHNHFWLQMAAYERLWAEYNPDMPIDEIAILWLNAKTRTDGKGEAIQGQGWQLKFSDKPIQEHWKLFRATQELWNTEFGSMKPRNTFYQLKHHKNGI